MRAVAAVTWAVLLPMFTSAFWAGQGSQALAESRLREYSVYCEPNSGCEADASPAARRVAVSGTYAGKDRLSVSVYEYPEAQAQTPLPILTMSAQRGGIRWPRPYPTVEAFLRYSPDARMLLAYDDVGQVHIFELESTPPREVRTIDLGLSKERPSLQPVDMEWSPRGGRIAVISSFKIFHEGIVRVYEVATGRLKWERHCDLVEMGGEAWSPDGRMLAVTLISGDPHNPAYPPWASGNLVILDGESGTVLLQIDTGDLAGPVCMGPENTVVTAPLHLQPRGHDRWHREVAKVWDARTGSLVRRIVSPGRDIHDRLELSADGRVLLGYVGKEKSGFVWHYLEDANRVMDRVFQLFDYKTGRVIATSPNLAPEGFCGQGVWQLDPRVPAFRLGPQGRRVLVYWSNSGCAPSVFEVEGADPLLNFK